MQETVSGVLRLLCALVAPVPVGTNLGLLHLLWMLVSGRLLAAPGARLPGLSDCRLSAPAVRRAWAAVGARACLVTHVVSHKTMAASTTSGR